MEIKNVKYELEFTKGDIEIVVGALNKAYMETMNKSAEYKKSNEAKDHALANSLDEYNRDVKNIRNTLADLIGIHFMGNEV